MTALKPAERARASAAEDARRAAILVRLQLVIMAAWGLIGLRHALLGRPLTGATQMVILALTAFVALAVRFWPGGWRVALHLTAALSTVGIIAISWWGGGAESIAWWFLAAVPLFVVHVGGRRAGLLWTVIAVAAIPVSIFVDLGMTEFVPGPFERLTSGIALALVCAAFGLLARGLADAHVLAMTEAAEARSDLLATIGHEVRTPLHGMTGTAALLADTELSSEQREMLTTILASGKALRKIVDDVLDVARLEAGRLTIDPHPVDLMGVIEDVVDLFASDASNKGLTLVATVEGAEHFWVRADGMRVRQILSNLVGNAVKFTEAGYVVVEAKASADGDARILEIAVEDSGPGLPQEKLAELFEAFQQLDAKLARLHGGSGLGLSLARHLTEQMGGTLGADPDRVGGARFELRLHLPAVEASPERTIGPNVHVLALEANPRLEAGLTSTAEALGVELVVVGTPDEAVEAAARRPPHLALVSVDSEVDPHRVHRLLRDAVGAHCPLVLALAHEQVGSHFGSDLASLFDGTTLTPIRRTRLRSLLDEASLARASHPTPLLLGRAIVLDDDRTSRRVLAVMLERRGFLVAAFGKGSDALVALGEERFDLMLCDLNMPEMDGVEVRRRAAELPSTAKTKFVVVSASVREADRRRCLDAGFDAYLTKPFEPAQLEELVARIRPKRAHLALAPVVEAPPEASLVDAVFVGKMRELLGDEVEDLIEDLSTNSRELLLEIQQTDSIDDAERAAHTIASGALQAGFVTLGERARELELTIREQSVEERRAAGKELGDLLDRSLAEMGIEPEGTARTAHLRFAGNLDEASVARELARAERAGGGALARVLVDCSAMSSYEPGARDAFERWFERNEGLESVAFVTRNRLWSAVVRSMSEGGRATMKSFWSLPEAENWLASGGSAPSREPRD